MHDDLEDFLTSADTPERASLLLDAYDAISVTGLRNHSYEIDQLLEEGESMDTVQTITAIHEVLLTIVEGCLNRFGVFVSDEAELKYMAGALRGLTLLDNYSDVETIQKICGSGQPPEEQLAELLELVTEHEASMYLLTFSRVTSRLITNVVGVLSLEGLAPEINDYTYIRVRLRSLLTAYPDLWVLTAVEEGVKLGTSIETVVAPFQTALEQLDAKQGAVQLLGLVFLTDTPDDRLQIALADWLERIYPDLNKVTQAAQVIKALLPQVSYA